MSPSQEQNPAESKSNSAKALEKLQRRIRVARGQAPGDLLLTGGQVVNVFTGQIERADVVIADGWIAGVGTYAWEAQRSISAEGKTILPGLFDAHMHLESTLMVPAELARLVVPHGTSSVVADPHEVGNVLGIRGIEMLLEASRGLPLDVFFMAPSCVPTSGVEHAGAVLDADAVGQLLDHPRVLGLAEMMDMAGVLSAQQDVLKKLVVALQRDELVDGHAPALLGRDLMAYAAAGIRSDHESSTPEEARQKAALGMMVQVREGSAARDLDALLPLLALDELGDWCLCTDDIYPDDLARDGHIDGLLRRLVAGGVPPARAVRHATLVPARHYGLRDRGAVAAGYRANLVVVADLVEFRADLVIHAGEEVARQGRYLATAPAASIPAENTIHLAPLAEKDFLLQVHSQPADMIEVKANQIVTHWQRAEVKQADGGWVFDPQHDVALVASIERHHASGNVGLGLVQGFGFQTGGALGSSVAHDSHNLIIAGTNPRDMLVCAQHLEKTGGGWVVVSGGQVQTCLPLPVAGLLSRSPASQLVEQLAEVRAAAHSLGCQLPSPFATLSFLALSVIPELRITDRGLLDVGNQQWLSDH